MKKLNFSELNWINTPENFSITENELVIHTSPDTDF
ncbi:DUF1349 domain-containing protein, partial [Pseudomonas syringae pv. pisi]